MKAPNIWKRAKKVVGVTTPKTSMRFPPTYTKALSILIEREQKRLGIKQLGRETIIMNLTMAGSNAYRIKQSELAEIYARLNKENQHVTTNTKQEVSEAQAQ